MPARPAHLARLDDLYLDESGPTAFVKAVEHRGDLPIPRDCGKRIAESPKGEELTIEEIV